MGQEVQALISNNIDKIRTLNNPYCTSKAARVIFSMKSLNIPPPSIPASSTPSSLTKVTRIWKHKVNHRNRNYHFWVKCTHAHAYLHIYMHVYNQIESEHIHTQSKCITSPRRSSSDNAFNWLKASSRIWSLLILNLCLAKRPWLPFLSLAAASCDCQMINKLLVSWAEWHAIQEID